MDQEIRVIGKLGRDPEMRFTQEGKAFTTYSIASSRYCGKGQDGKGKYETTWWKVTTWESQAERDNNYLSKGDTIQVKGYLNVDPKTGVPKTYSKQDGGVGVDLGIHPDLYGGILYINVKKLTKED